MQSKQQKRLKALNNLIAQAEEMRSQRARLQTQVYYTIVPCNQELRLAQDINRLRLALGLSAQVRECPF